MGCGAISESARHPRPEGRAKRGVSKDAQEGAQLEHPSRRDAAHCSSGLGSSSKLFILLTFLRLGRLAHHRSRPPISMYFNSTNSSTPWREPSRPMPDSFTPADGAAVND